jgi:hypothetical protein
VLVLSPLSFIKGSRGVSSSFILSQSDWASTVSAFTCCILTTLLLPPNAATLYSGRYFCISTQPSSTLIKRAWDSFGDMTKKFTYSRKDKARPRNNEDSAPDDEDGSRKRQKTDSPSETSSFVSVPTISSTASSIRAKSSAIFKKTSQLFGGPISIPSDDAEIEITPKSRKSLSGLFDKALQGRVQPQKPKALNIHGSRDEFIGTMQVRQKEAHSTQPSGSYLPTPPSEVQRLRSNGTGSSSSSYGLAPKTTITNATCDESSEANDLCRKRSKSKPQKKLYVPKTYIAEKTAQSGADLFGDPFPKRSNEVQL